MSYVIFKKRGIVDSNKSIVNLKIFYHCSLNASLHQNVAYCVVHIEKTKNLVQIFLLNTLGMRLSNPAGTFNGNQRGYTASRNIHRWNTYK